ncbi:unnamed protein product, partial [Allacma fusca]
MAKFLQFANKTKIAAAAGGGDRR